jgi:hypothetical protein
MSENFLSRWSRRKRASTSPRAVADSVAAPRGEDATERAAATSARLRGEVGSRSDPGEGGSRPAEPVESPPHPDTLPAIGEGEFDPASLPPIESINAGTDVSAFLRPGVPADLAQAALRRAWVADPAIRDFVGLAENAWDFNAPGGVPGFGPLRAIDDVQRLAAQVAGILPAVQAESAVGKQAEAVAPEAEAAPQTLPVESSDAAVVPVDNAAMQEEGPTQDTGNPPRPRHGGALPE